MAQAGFQHEAIATAERAVQARRYVEAACAYEAAFACAPAEARTIGNYGGLLIELCRFDEAAATLTRAVELDPGRPALWLNLGIAMLELQRFDDAIAAFSNALRLRPAHVGTLSALGVALHRRGAAIEALRFHELALSLDPGNPHTRFNRAVALLAVGDYPAGLPAFEARFEVDTAKWVEGPRWSGESFAGRTLLVLVEAGIGDVLQFARFLPLARARGGRVVVRTWPTLAGLLSRLDGVDAVVTMDAPLPAYDLVCPIMSLALALNVTIDTIPSPAGYLTPDPGGVAVWRDRLEADAVRHGRADPLRVGLVWAGAPRPWNRLCTLTDRRRSLDLAKLEPLFDARPDTLFYSLQIGETALPPEHGLPIIDHTGLIHSFDDTACLVTGLDLVIAVDTSTAHLAGGLGKPVWLLSRYDRCWRWLTGRTDTPWYSDMRLYVQPEPGDWAEPIARIRSDLARIPRHGNGMTGR